MSLLDTGQIAALLGQSRKHVTERVVKRPDFPAPKVAISRKCRRWTEEDVLDWISRVSRRSQPA